MRDFGIFSRDGGILSDGYDEIVRDDGISTRVGDDGTESCFIVFALVDSF